LAHRISPRFPTASIWVASPARRRRWIPVPISLLLPFEAFRVATGHLAFDYRTIADRTSIPAPMVSTVN
jgi:hypothetical protein